MDTVTVLSLPRLARFVRQHTHDICNDLNGLELEAVLLSALAPGAEAGESVARMRAQIRRLATGLHGLAAKFVAPRPVRASYSAHELFFIWQDQLAGFDPVPEVRWSEALGEERVNVDAAALAEVFRELMLNAQRFGSGAPMFAASRAEAGFVVFELREPKEAVADTADWGRAPLSEIQHGHYGLGLWSAQSAVVASGGELKRCFVKDSMELVTTLRFPVA